MIRLQDPAARCLEALCRYVIVNGNTSRDAQTIAAILAQIAGRDWQAWESERHDRLAALAAAADEMRRALAPLEAAMPDLSEDSSGPEKSAEGLQPEDPEGR